MIEDVKPLFKYIGGKTWLRNELRENLESVLENNPNIDSYVEPFSGGLGAFLSVADILKTYNVKNVFLSDINKVLIETYKLIQNNPQSLIDEFILLEEGFVKEVDISWKNTKNKDEIKSYLKNANLYFAKIKKEFNNSSADDKQCARLVFLQKHSFNGIYRENSKGEYNTPFNWSGNNMIDSFEEKVKEIHNLFKCFNITFNAQSFEQNDFSLNAVFYLDPPYINDESVKGENKYNKDFFSVEKQLELINKIANTKFIYSNHKNEILLTEFKKINGVVVKDVNRKNIMTSKASNRGDDRVEILVISK